MARNVTCLCPMGCEFDVIAAVDAEVFCPEHKLPSEQQWWRRSSQRETVWDRSEWATVFKASDGKYRFPGRADAPTPAGYARITIKSDADMARVEHEAGVRSERRWFDRGSGNGHDTRDLPPLPDLSGITIRQR